MHALFIHSEIDLGPLGQLLPNARLFAPCAEGLPDGPPFLVRVETNDEFSITQTAILNLEAQGHAITALHHPRSPKPLTDAHIEKLQKHTPAIKKGDCMRDLLSHIHAACPSNAWDPELHCY